MTSEEMLSYLRPLVDSLPHLDKPSSRTSMSPTLSRMFVYAEGLGVTVPWSKDLDYFSDLWGCIKVLVVELWPDEPGFSSSCDLARLEILNRMMTESDEVPLCRKNAIKEVGKIVKEVSGVSMYDVSTSSRWPSKYSVSTESVWKWMQDNRWMVDEGWINLEAEGENQNFKVIGNLIKIQQRLERDMNES